MVKLISNILLRLKANKNRLKHQEKRVQLSTAPEKSYCGLGKTCHGELEEECALPPLFKTKLKSNLCKSVYEFDLI